jgi:predicted DNA-binding transcriptional regulator YafY
MTPRKTSDPKAPNKLQRWVDLMAALLSHHGTQTFADIAKHVPAYTRGNLESIKRTFERDKDELRELGVPLETIGNDGDEDTAYRLRSKEFYLPYLSLVSERGLEKPSRVDKFGYHAIGALTFDSEELAAVAEAAARVRHLGDPDLEANAASAMRKLAFDLPVDSALAGAEGTVIRQPRAAADAATLRLLGKALVARKRVTIAYTSMSSGRDDSRAVEPYGLFFMGSHWYLAARDVTAGRIKNFRVNRITGAKVNAAKAATPDYAIPADFRLRDHAQSHQAWELGEGEAMTAVVEIRGKSGATAAAAELGEAVPGKPRQRSFRVRRADVFARWCLSFAGEIVPLSPPEIVIEYRRQLDATRALYAS